MNRNVLRLSPVTGTSPANQPEIIALARRIFPPVFACDPPVAHRVSSLSYSNFLLILMAFMRHFQYKIQCRVRNNHKLESQVLVPELARSVPSDRGHKVDLENPEVVVLVEVYQAGCSILQSSRLIKLTLCFLAIQTVCGMSVVPSWIKYKRYNVVEYVQSLHREEPGVLQEDPTVFRPSDGKP